MQRTVWLCLGKWEVGGKGFKARTVQQAEEVRMSFLPGVAWAQNAEGAKTPVLKSELSPPKMHVDMLMSHVTVFEPKPFKEVIKVVHTKSLTVMSDSLQPHGL